MSVFLLTVLGISNNWDLLDVFFLFAVDVCDLAQKACKTIDGGCHSGRVFVISTFRPQFRG